MSTKDSLQEGRELASEAGMSQADFYRQNKTPEQLTVKEALEEDIEAFNENANEVFEAFCKSMTGDDRFTRPPGEDEKWMAEEEGWQWIYTDRAMGLIETMRDRLYALATKKFGESAVIDYITIESPYYREA